MQVGGNPQGATHRALRSRTSIPEGSTHLRITLLNTIKLSALDLSQHPNSTSQTMSFQSSTVGSWRDPGVDNVSRSLKTL